MDKVIARYEGKPDGDLVICRAHGVAWQADMTHRVDVPYYYKCSGYKGQDIANKINRGRVDFVNRFVGSDCPVLDIGIGSGEFIESRPNTFGYDVDQDAQNWLKRNKKWVDDFTLFKAFTFWDVIEHIENPQGYFQHMGCGSKIFVCLPTFANLDLIRESKHYRPGEHLYYWTDAGFIDWMAAYWFALIGRASFETEAGRESIETFAFERV